MHLISNLIAHVIRFACEEAQQKSTIRGNRFELLVKFHSEIGNMVRSSMMKLNNKELVEQIEEKSG
jgi:uncharacterized membrane-anchored protein YjiN (DUF445 family)